MLNDAGQGPMPIPPQPVSRHVAVSGSSGLLGSALHARLTAAGHRVTRIVRSRPGEGDVLWDPTAPSFDSAKLAGVDAFVHLAGENIATRRWTPSVKRRILGDQCRHLGGLVFFLVDDLEIGTHQFEPHGQPAPMRLLDMC